MNKIQFLKGFSGRPVSITNLVSNGDMSSGTTGWRHYENFSTESVADGILKSTKADVRPYVGTTSTWNIATGRKLYCAALLSGNKNGLILASLYGTWALNDGGRVSASVTTSPVIYSDVVTVANYNVNGVVLDGQGFTSNGDYINVDNVIVIDLTAAWGAGNEPTKAQMDGLMMQFTNRWFSGTVTAIYTW